MIARTSIALPLFLATLNGIAQHPAAFVENRGQWPKSVTHKADLNGATVWCERGAILIDRFDGPAIRHANDGPDQPDPVVRHHAVRLRFTGANPGPTCEGLGPQHGTYNYFLGNDPGRWARGAHAFSAVLQKDLYPGVDLRVRTKGPSLKYDLILAPEADPSGIRITYEGADGIALMDGRIVIRTSVGDVIEHIPTAYQEIDGEPRTIPCHYTKTGTSIGFLIGAHSADHPVIIDPVLSFSTFSGSTSDNFGYTATYDADGFLYSGSSAFGQGYPTTTGAYQTQHAGGQGLGDGIDVALTKFDTTGQFLIWSTFLGGAGDELPHSMIVNGANELFVYGTTSSMNFPVTNNAYDPSFNGGTATNPTGLGANYVNGSDIFIARLGSNGDALLASTYFGGSQNDGFNGASGLKHNYADEIRGEVLLDANDNVLVASCTASPDLPVTTGAAQMVYGGGPQDGVVLKMDAQLSTLFWSTYFGGSLADAVYSIELDDDDRVFICGGTRSTDLNMPVGAFQPAFQGGITDGFAAVLLPDGSAVTMATYFGSTAYDQAYFVELDQEGRVYLYGQTQASAGQLVSNAPYNIPNAGQFIAKFDPGLTTLLMGSRFGSGDGDPDISPTAFLVDYCDKIYISGWGSAVNGNLSTTGLPVTPDAFQPTTDGNDFYLAVFDIDMNGLFYATYFGGSQSHEHVDGGTSRFDRRGRVYEAVCAGCGGHDDFPSTPGAWSPTNNSTNCNLGVFKFDFNFPIVTADFDAVVNCLPAPVTFTDHSYGATGHTWTFGDGGSSTDPAPEHTYDQPGVYTVTLVSFNSASCNLSDTMYRQVVVLGNAAYALPDTFACTGTSVQIGLLPVDDPSVTFAWSPSQGLSNTSVPNPVATPTGTITYTLLMSNGACTDTITQTITVPDTQLDAGPDILRCGPDASATLTANGFGTTDQFQWSSNNSFTDTLNAVLADSTVVVQLTGTTLFYVRAPNDPCGAYDSVQVVVQLAAPLLTGDSLICAEDVARLHVIGAEPGSSITWSPNADIDTGQGTANATVSPPAQQTFSVDVVSPAGCTWTGSITVTVSPLFGNTMGASVDQPIVLSGTTVQLSAMPDSGVTYAWTPPNEVSDPSIANPTAYITGTSTFIVTITDGICTRNDSVTVTVHEMNCAEPDIYIPDAFTPNGDGNNDVLLVRGRFITTMQLKVFDRWGELVFETTDQDVGWVGTYKGKPVDPAVFVYWLKAVCADGQSFLKKGNITVIR